MFAAIGRRYREYPPKFWLVVGVSFIDIVGGTILYPFFTLYLTWKFNIGMVQAGAVLGIFSVFRIASSIIGGALTDRFGRKRIILCGLVFSAISTLALGLVNSVTLLYPVSALVGLLSSIAGPAHQAMIADLLPEEKRAEGYGVLRVMMNLAWIVGPTIGGIIANHSYFALFVIDALFSTFVAVLFSRLVAETHPQAGQGKSSEGLVESFRGYGRVVRNAGYMAFMLISILMGLVYIQMYGSLSIYVRDYHGIQPQGYGMLMSTSAVTVILLQFAVSRRSRNRSPFVMMALGAFLYAVGFTMFGFDPLSQLQTVLQAAGSLAVNGTFVWFMAAIVMVTFGEMVVMPVSQALAANFASEHMRGRYLAVYSLGMAIPSAVGPILAGLVLDSPVLNPDLLWYLGGLLCALSAAAFLGMHTRFGAQGQFSSAAPEPPDAHQAHPEACCEQTVS